MRSWSTTTLARSKTTSRPSPLMPGWLLSPVNPPVSATFQRHVLAGPVEHVHVARVVRVGWHELREGRESHEAAVSADRRRRRIEDRPVCIALLDGQHRAKASRWRQPSSAQLGDHLEAHAFRAHCLEDVTAMTDRGDACVRLRRTCGEIDAVELLDDVLELVRDELFHVIEAA